MDEGKQEAEDDEIKNAVGLTGMKKLRQDILREQDKRRSRRGFEGAALERLRRRSATFQRGRDVGAGLKPPSSETPLIK